MPLPRNLVAPTASITRRQREARNGHRGVAILLTGATLGGYAGGALGEKLPPALLRSFVILVGSTMTLYYFWSTYLG